MLRLSLRHINLQAVYEQLDEYDPFQGPESCLANIPRQLSQTLSYQLDEIAGAVFDDLLESPWQDSHPRDVAAEVEEFIGGAILFLDEDNQLPFDDDREEHEDSTSETLDKFAAVPLTNGFIS